MSNSTAIKREIPQAVTNKRKLLKSKYLQSGFLLDLKFCISAVAVAIIFTSVSGQVWNGIRWCQQSRLISNMELIIPNHELQHVPESIAVLLLYGALAGTFALFTECMRRKSRATETNRAALWISLQVFAVAFVILINVARIKQPGYLVATYH